MKNKPRKRSGFSFRIDKERLFELAKMPVVARLNWLEEANKFFNSISDKKFKKLWRLARENK